MRDEEIEALLANARPRGLPGEDRQRIIERILSAGECRNVAWYQRPVALWKVAAVIVLTAGIAWFGATVGSGDRPRSVPRGSDTRVVAASISPCRSYLQVDPIVFRGGDDSETRGCDVGIWRVLTDKATIQTDEEEE